MTTSYSYGDALGLGPFGEHTASEWAAPAPPRPAGLTSAASWAELCYCAIVLVPAITFFVVTVTLLSLGMGLAVIYVGVPILMLGLIFARAGGFLQRGLARVLLDLPVAAPPLRAPGRPGVRGVICAVLTDGSNWRAVAYHCVASVLAPLQFCVAIGFYSAGLGGVTYPLWRLWLPTSLTDDGSRHRGWEFVPNHFVDTPATMAVQFLVAAVVLLAAPKAVRFVTSLDRVLIAGLLGR